VLCQALLPVGQAYTGKLIVDGVLHAITDSLSLEDSVRLIWPLLAIEFALFAAGSLLSLNRRLAEQVLEQRAGHRITESIIEKALELPLPYFEDSTFYDGMQKARREAEYRALAIINGLFSLCQNAITLVSFAFVLLAMTPWVALALFYRHNTLVCCAG
jgi:ATP-binding cassette subfamily B protein